MVTATSAKITKSIPPDAREMGPAGINDRASLDERRLRTPAPAPRVNVVQHPVAQHALATLRSRETDPARFRAGCTQLLLAIVAEALRNMALQTREVESFDGPFSARVMAKPVVFLPLARAGLGLTHPLADLIPDVSLGSISFEHGGENRRPEPRLHMVNAPALSEARVLLFDPVISSGLSATVALHLARNSGATDCALLSFVASEEGLKRVHAAMPDIQVWTGAVESRTGRDGKPVSGLGDFSRRLYR